MPILSRPLFGLVRKGGQIIWKEDSAARFPKLRKLPESVGKVMLFALFVGIPIFIYLRAQLDFNPDSWYTKTWKKLYPKLYNLPATVLGLKSESPVEEKSKESETSIFATSEKDMDRIIKKLGFTF
ncbi:hypothetical protein Mgra_00003045 [Meloidogyne graminicola]|uniref:Uncharacterized protein n=1 Tax=Meloidogyne graminicola TaxID=189291 RepID=A0A8S9ZV79_9BILA|nr:hypothetical protein Mgra_00003045 [Meloidogyne graminicola]